MDNFVVSVQCPDGMTFKEREVRTAIARYIASNDEEAERYGPDLAGYRIGVRAVASTRKDRD
jgi:hypothetical protein